MAGKRNDRPVALLGERGEYTWKQLRMWCRTLGLTCDVTFDQFKKVAPDKCQTCYHDFNKEFPMHVFLKDRDADVTVDNLRFICSSCDLRSASPDRCSSDWYVKKKVKKSALSKCLEVVREVEDFPDGYDDEDKYEVGWIDACQKIRGMLT